ncbi:MAG: Gfo/Idh/MocA family oxidoreductase [Chloroflexi bacterium]|nr:Gfo/Idh/MocA family oxidoreductase [Chloroflexota bacterium]
MTLRFGLIGTGFWARTVHAAGVQHHPDAELVGVWGRDPHKAAELAGELGTRAYAEVDALFADVDALTFAVPPDVQSDLAVRAAEAGRHVLLEKPIATSVADALRLEAAVAHRQLASIVFFTRRFVPETAAWLQRVTDLGGWDCGRVENASAALVDGGSFSASPWRHAKGALWDVGPHALSLLCAVLGDVTEVIASGGRGDQVHLVLRHAAGASSTMSLSLTVPPPAAGSTFYLYGESGRMIAPATSLQPAQIVEAHASAIDALIGQIERPGTGHPCDVRFGRYVVQILEAAERSSTSGRKLQVVPPPNVR